MQNAQDDTLEPPRSPVNQRRGVRRLVAATGFSLAGLVTAWQTEEAFRLESVLAAVMLPAALWLGTGTVERLLLAGSVLLVLIVELLNTAVEYTVDRIGTEQHALSGRAKDLGSAAVMLSIGLVLMTWGAIAWDRFGPAV